MERPEFEQVLANWIAQVTTPPGAFAAGIDPPQWVAQQILQWWHPRVSDTLLDAESGVMSAWYSLEQLGGWSNHELGDALHELIHVRDALGTLRAMLCQLTEKQTTAE